jgi:ATP-dependent DNA helicase PIF1
MNVTLSQEQIYALEKFKQGENIFITGQGGTGKTLLVKHLTEHANLIGKKYQVCALTGCAALLLGCNARTIHSWSGIKICRGENEQVVESVLRNRNAMKAWKEVQILFIDEVSMMSKKIFDVLCEIGRLTKKSDRPFGNIQVVFIGDFYQLPPVGSPGEPDTDAFCFESANWPLVFSKQNHIELKTMFRQSDPIYQTILGQIRRGSIDEENSEILRQHVDRVYDPAAHNDCVPTKLFPTRVKTDFVNNNMFIKLPDQEFVFEVVKKKNCKTIIETGKILTPEVLSKSSKLTEDQIKYELMNLQSNSSCVPLLKLKKGAVVMCLINLDMENGICNGSQGVVIDILPGISPVPVVKFTNGLTRQIHPHYWQSDEYPTIAIGQIPLCLAWAITIHKIQGATLSLAEMDLGNSIFEYGQTYVALSRIQSLDGLYLSSFHPQRIKANPKVVAFYRAMPILDYTIVVPPLPTITEPTTSSTVKIIKL